MARSPQTHPVDGPGGPSAHSHQTGKVVCFNSSGAAEEGRWDQMRPRGVPQTSPALHQRLTSQPRPVAPGPATTILALAAHQRPRASLALARPLSLPPPEASSLDWTPQKQNHKPISVTLPMRLDGSDLSPLGGGGAQESLQCPTEEPFLPDRAGACC